MLFTLPNECIKVKISMSKLDNAHSQLSEIVVGKDILELLSSSMYVDPLTIFREYVQNAADAIDEAVEAGELISRSEGLIEIRLDHINRRARIRDNGIGVANADFARLLTSFGASHKRGSNSRGFRGVGRLAGLGYCQELVFRSRATSEEPVLELSWDCKALKKLLTDPTYNGSLPDLVREVTALREVEGIDIPNRFFEVDIIRPRRIGRDILVNEVTIRDYLRQVAPVPFSKNFKLADEVALHFNEMDFELPVYSIQINDEDLITRPFGPAIDYSDIKSGQFHNIEPIAVLGQDGETAAIGWIAHHDYQGAIPEKLGIRGLRARVGNIQIGGERLFLEIFPEERFNSWTIGEIHILDRRITPNGRRDDFDHSPQLANLINHLSPVGMKIARHCRSSSQERNRIKQFELSAQKAEQALDTIDQGALTKRRQQELQRDVGAKLGEMRNAAGFDLLHQSVKREFDNKLVELETRLETVSEKGAAEDPLATLPEYKQPIYREVISLIYECSANQIAATSLVNKLLDRLGGKPSKGN